MLEDELAAIYTLYEQELQEWIASYKRDVSCYKGCSACCNFSIGLYLPEALVLAQSLTDEQYGKVAEHAQRVLAYARKTPDYLAGFRYSGIGWCPFLETATGNCSIYDRRPANCRHLYSNMSPEYCVSGIEKELERHPQKRAEFLQHLDPGVNEDGLPFIAPLQDIFHEKYVHYLTILTAKYCNFLMLGEMSWLLTLAREHDLWGMVTAPGITVTDFRQHLQNTGWYHDNVLTDCQEILPEVKEQSASIDFARIAERRNNPFILQRHA